MAVRPLCFDPDPVLREVADPVLQFDVDALVADLFDTMYDAQGRGLAAPQVGVLQRVFVIDTTWKEGERQPVAFVNPEITGMSPKVQPGPEACLSIPDRVFEVGRPEWVDMAWMTSDGASMTARFAGIEAICVCHELDHLNGILITDCGVEV